MKVTNMNKPETLYDLCELTAEAIETRPLNYCQDYWAHDAKDMMRQKNPELVREACGTAFCRAGWMYALSSEKVLNPGQWGLVKDRIFSKMMAKLKAAGIPEGTALRLFSGSQAHGADDTDSYHQNLRNETVGTAKYAKIGADGMRRFMHEFEKELRAAKV